MGLIEYVKESRSATTPGQRSKLPDEQSQALGALRVAGIRLDRARRDLDAAQANNRDSLRKSVPVPWREFFDAVTGAQRAMSRVVQAFDVR